MPIGKYKRTKGMMTGKHNNHKAWNKGKTGIISTKKGRKYPHLQGENNALWKGGYKNQLKWQAAYILKKKEKIAGRPRPEKCELCGGGERICFDHSHITGEFRGWICHKCNATLGFVDDDIELLEKMVNYLRIAKKAGDLQL